MKKNRQSIWLGGFLFLLATGVLQAQDSIPVKSLPAITVTPANSKVPTRVWRSFDAYFASAQNPMWYEVNKNHLVKFMTEGNENKALFTRRGNLVYHISYGYEHRLPEDIRKMVKSVYYDYDITRAILVDEADREVWVINVEDDHHLILIHIEDGDMEEIQKLTKS